VTDGVRLLGVTNSVRPGSLNRMVLELVGEVVPGGVALEVFDLQGIPFFDIDLERERVPQRVMELATAVAGCDGVVLASPEYNHSIPPILKNAIDWLSRIRTKPLRELPFMLVSATPGMLGGARVQYEIRRVLDAVEARPMVRPEVFIGGADRKFDAAGRCIDASTRACITQQVAAFLDFVRKSR
jgi:chromate reductase